METEEEWAQTGDKGHRPGGKNLEPFTKGTENPGEKRGGMKVPEKARGRVRVDVTQEVLVEVLGGIRSWQMTQEIDAGDQNTERKGMG